MTRIMVTNDDGIHASGLGVCEEIARQLSDDVLVVAPEVAKLGSHRISLTSPVLNRAEAILFLVTGGDKAEALAAVLQGPFEPDAYPSQVVSPSSGALIWLVDRAAAARLAGAPGR